MNRENIELFRRLRERADISRQPYADERLEQLLGLVKPEQARIHYIGESSPNPNCFFHYLLCLWQQEAVIGVEHTQYDGYTFFHLGLDLSMDPIQFKGIYATHLPQKNPAVGEGLRKVVMTTSDGSSEREQWMLKGILLDALGSQANNGMN